MRDHQRFQETVLPNGIRVYTYRGHFPIACMEIQLPVGSAHAIAQNGLPPGSPHFLEHVQLIRSQQFPEAYALDRYLGLKAGNNNSVTHPKATTHWVDTPTLYLKEGTEALIDRVFHPLFRDEDLEIERSVVINERNQHRFYPGKNKVSQYFYQEFMDDTFFPLEQIFGSDQDLEGMTVSSLEKMHHQITSSKDIVALGVGSDDFDLLKERLAALPTQNTNFVPKIAPTVWKKPEFHTVYFDSIPQPRLDIGWIHPRLPYNEYQAVTFIINFLINSTLGPLYREFREEKGWTYGIDGGSAMREHNTILGFSFPLNTAEQVHYVRDCVLERINSALSDQKLIEDEITRQLGNQVYSFQTAGSIISSASSDLLTFNHVYSEANYRKAIFAMRNPDWRKEMSKKYFSAENLGSVCFMPERRQNRV